MPKVYFPPQMRDLTGGVDRAEIDGATLGQVVASLEALFPGLAARVREGDSLAPGLAVSIDGGLTSRGMLAKVNPASEIHFLPAIGGG
jgi:molybdopterin synthase sulfur carrier subunit